MRLDLWIIESRNPDGSLNLSDPQPDKVFGISAITGMSSDAMAKRIFRTHPDAVLSGDSIATWPRVFNPNWLARRKTW